ncbi:NADH dehydrogenase (ubiquinone) complex I, assembly factor 6-like [Macrosteles quadrilineatus]|uniref:NADH dehydrogenase (ubiquinone) complex I, assembly factor 6-like n=1 Tax=Macrosteles quadrilineatus TaxID=74068 RepID=UPI0023E27A81|nr:NADH dehydrogenase (ubiquinone) complex I, assembly factor 6-like [Macrosteles quadrilineatus]
MEKAMCKCARLIHSPVLGHWRSIRYFSSATNAGSSHNYCLDLVRKYDYENFLSSLLLANSVRSTAFAVRSFNVEISKVQDQVSNHQLAQMRLKFWLETIDSLFKNQVREHPVAQELHKAIGRHKLQKTHLKNLVLARTNQLSSTFPNLEAMEKYAELSVSSIYYMLLQASGIQNVHADHAASHLGKAQGLANLVRSLPHHCTRRDVPLPQDVLARHRVSHETVLRGHRDQPVRDVIFEVASRAKQHLDKARSLKDKVPEGTFILLLPAASTSWFLDQLQKFDFDVFHPKLQRRHHLLPWTLYLNKFLKRY